MINPMEETERCFKLTCSDIITYDEEFQQFLTLRVKLRGLSLDKKGKYFKQFTEGIVRIASPVNCFSNSKNAFFQLFYKETVLSFQEIDTQEANVAEKGILRKMYISGIKATTSTNAVIRYFQQFGRVAFCQLIAKPGRKGVKFGYLIFEKRESLDLVYGTRPHVIDNVEVSVCDFINNSKGKFKAQKKPHQDQAPTTNSPRAGLKKNKTSSRLTLDTRVNSSQGCPVQKDMNGPKEDGSLILSSCRGNLPRGRGPPERSLFYISSNERLKAEDVSNLRFNVSLFPPSYKV